jgi:acetyl esterase
MRFESLSETPLSIMSQPIQKIAPIGEERDKELLKSATTYVYVNHNGFDLIAHVFFPETQASTSRPAIVFFHGGFWDVSMLPQFVPHAHHFTSRGMVAISFEYRVSSKHQSTPTDAIDDSIFALNWLNSRAGELGIDLTKMVFSGAAGGAYLALLLGMRKDKDLSPPFRPKALILFSALVNTTPKGQHSERFPSKKISTRLSPTQLVRRKLPPMIFFHGTSDRVTPFSEIVTFCRRMRWRGNRCKFFDFNGSEHSFFNFNVSHSNFELTINAADRFLVDLGIIQEQPEETYEVREV